MRFTIKKKKSIHEIQAKFRYVGEWHVLYNKLNF